MKKAIHLAAFDRNIGDNGLNLAIEKMLSNYFNISRMEIVGNSFGKNEVKKINECDLIIFGGGGLIHSCSGGSSRKNRTRTGTMWNIEMKDLISLKPKIVAYGVGYNRFVGEPGPLPVMGKFFEVLRKKESIASFRNDNSINNFLSEFPEFNQYVQEIPDPGLFCRHETTKKSDHVVIQIATDRMEFRYPNGFDKFLDFINSILDQIPYKTILIPHTSSDEKIYKKYKNKIKVDVIYPLMNRMEQTMKVIEVYKRSKYTISTRGHSQLFSIGNGIPTFSISTHNKVKEFMENNNLSEYNHDYLNSSNKSGLDKFKHFRSNLIDYSERIEKLNTEFDQIIEKHWIIWVFSILIFSFLIRLWGLLMYGEI